jgi:cell division septum initiation protein DivIVA
MISGYNPQEIQDLDGARQAIGALLNLVEELVQENQSLRAEVQGLRDEVNRLKGEQGKPDVKANKTKDNDHSSEKERRTKTTKKSSSRTYAWQRTTSVLPRKSITRLRSRKPIWPRCLPGMSGSSGRVCAVWS